MFQVQLELASVLFVHVPIFESLLLLDKVHVTLQLFTGGHLNSVQVSLRCTKCFLESDFAFVDVLPTARFVAWLTSAP